MSAAFYIVLEKELSEIDVSVNGKALANAQKLLDKIAKDFNITNLMDLIKKILNGI